MGTKNGQFPAADVGFLLFSLNGDLSTLECEMVGANVPPDVFNHIKAVKSHLQSLDEILSKIAGA